MKYGWADWWRMKCGWVECVGSLLGSWFIRMLISLTNAYTGCGRPALNFIECFWLGSVCSASKLDSKCTPVNYEMNCITMHICTEIYSNVLQMAQVHWQVPVLLIINNRYSSVRVLIYRSTVRPTNQLAMCPLFDFRRHYSGKRTVHKNTIYVRDQLIGAAK